ncbi:hypothetical protein [Acidipropionibacterium timonense]|uniref:hypothetical protein n=1 Tax=Acidipropionibacterium timonense TaxID=2161818 RepID=UPI0010321204|nr:hypothetical protein [Acidipropionibacterium timonense]
MAARMVLASVALLADETGVAVASRPTLASMARSSTASVGRTVARLCQDGWLERQARRMGNRQGATCWRLGRRFMALRPAVESEGGAPAVVSGSQRRGRAGGQVVLAGGSGDVLTGAGLRAVLRAVAADGWDCEEAAGLPAAIMATASTRAAWVARRRAGHATTAETVADLATALWLVMRQQPGQVAAAANPWGYAVTAAARQVAAADEQDAARREVLDCPEDPSGPAPWEQSSGPVQVSLEDLMASSSVGYRRLVQVLCGAGVAESLAWAGTCRCAQLAADHHAAARHTAARRDARLAGLGLSPDAASAWMSLLVGTRRGGPARSVLLRLRAGERVESDPQVARWLATIVACTASGVAA